MLTLILYLNENNIIILPFANNILIDSLQTRFKTTQLKLLCVIQQIKYLKKSKHIELQIELQIIFNNIFNFNDGFETGFVGVLLSVDHIR